LSIDHVCVSADDLDEESHSYCIFDISQAQSKKKKKKPYIVDSKECNLTALYLLPISIFQA
jgi:hypothetical protein